MAQRDIRTTMLARPNFVNGQSAKLAAEDQNTDMTLLQVIQKQVNININLRDVKILGRIKLCNT